MTLLTNLSCQEIEQVSRCFAVNVEDIKLEIVFCMPLIFSGTSCYLAELRHFR